MCNTLGRGSLVEHAAEGNTIDVASVDAKTDDAPRELVHDDEHPVALQENGFAPKQINAPEAVCPSCVLGRLAMMAHQSDLAGNVQRGHA